MLREEKQLAQVTRGGRALAGPQSPAPAWLPVCAECETERTVFVFLTWWPQVHTKCGRCAILGWAGDLDYAPAPTCTPQMATWPPTEGVQNQADTHGHLGLWAGWTQGWLPVPCPLWSRLAVVP